MFLAWLNTRPYVSRALHRMLATRQVLRRAAVITAPPPPPSIGALLDLAGRYAGPLVAERHVLEFSKRGGLILDRATPADRHLIESVQALIAEAIGSDPARLVVSMLCAGEGAAASRAWTEALATADVAALEIHRNRTHLTRAMAAMVDGFAVYDADDRLVAWNDALETMLTLPPDIMRVGAPMAALIRAAAERGIYGYAAPIDALVAERTAALLQPSGAEWRLAVHADRILASRSQRLPDGGLLVSYRDATAQVASEDLREAENLRLEERVRLRTIELERLNLELARAKAEADDANFSKSRFLAAATHDLQQPLSAARLYLAVLGEHMGDVPSFERKLAGNLETSLDAIEDILDALAEISRLDGGVTSVQLANVRVEDLLQHLAVDFEAEAARKGLRFTIVPSSLTVVTDPKLLRRLLRNIVANAIKYTPAGRILIGARRCGDRVRFVVHDTGIGIPPEKQQLIFREFERLPEAARVAAGAGLGLSIVERLAALLGHDVRVRSHVGTGSCFSVDAPLVASAPPEAAAAANPPMIGFDRSLEGLVVALIAADGETAAALALLLIRWGCEPVVGGCAEDVQAKAAAKAIRPTVLLVATATPACLPSVTASRRAFGPLPTIVVGANITSDLEEDDVHCLRHPLRPAALRALLWRWRPHAV